MPPREFQTFADFWPYYLREHSRPATRVLHAAGTTVSTVLLIALLIARKWAWLPVPFLVGYGVWSIQQINERKEEALAAAALARTNEHKAHDLSRRAIAQSMLVRARRYAATGHAAEESEDGGHRRQA